MVQCVGTTGSGTQCKNGGNVFESYCGIHHKQKYNHDGAYKLRYDARPVGAIDTAEVARIRAKKIQQRDRHLESLSQPSVHDIDLCATHLINLWKEEAIPGFHCVHAYIVLKYYSIHTVEKIPAMIHLVKMATSLFYLSNNKHPDYKTYAEVPLDERTAALHAIRTALRPFGRFHFGLLPSSDSNIRFVRQRIFEEEEQERRAEEERRRQLDIDLRERAVVFRRDPEGGIDLAAFATDAQNIHRSSVQTATEKAIRQLMNRPVNELVETLPEIIVDLQNPLKIKITSLEFRNRMVTELTHDYFETIAFSIPYGDVLDRVWLFIRSHKERDELFVRLGQEIAEGVGQCTNGKMARLVNVLQGYDDTLEVDPPREAFHDKIAKLMKLPKEERIDMARSLFLEFSIPVEEQTAWIDSLNED
jgi:hypothetical protein